MNNFSFSDFLGLLVEGQYSGSYAGVRFNKQTVKELQKLQKELGLKNPVPANKFHATVLYSRKFLPNYEPPGKIDEIETSPNFELDVFKTSTGKRALVLKFKSDELSKRHEYLMDYHQAPPWDWVDYTPHVTLSYDLGGQHIQLGPIKFKSGAPLVITEEYGEDLKL